MTPSLLAHEVYSSFYATMVLSAPFLVVAAIIGLTLALIQAVTQIQDQSLPQIVKILTVSGMAIAFGAILGTPLYEFTLRVFVGFPTMVR